jgi:hypothetical protein
MLEILLVAPAHRARAAAKMILSRRRSDRKSAAHDGAEIRHYVVCKKFLIWWRADTLAAIQRSEIMPLAAGLRAPASR